LPRILGGIGDLPVAPIPPGQPSKTPLNLLLGLEASTGVSRTRAAWARGLRCDDHVIVQRAASRTSSSMVSVIRMISNPSHHIIGHRSPSAKAGLAPEQTSGPLH
jgi:hypothetical protein